MTNHFQLWSSWKTQWVGKGDYVVHQVHGIGQYLGLETIEISGVHRGLMPSNIKMGGQFPFCGSKSDAIKYVAVANLLKSINSTMVASKRPNKGPSRSRGCADDLIQLYAERNSITKALPSLERWESNVWSGFPYVGNRWSDSLYPRN